MTQVGPLFDGGTETEFFPVWKREIDESQPNVRLIERTRTKNSVSLL